MDRPESELVMDAIDRWLEAAMALLAARGEDETEVAWSEAIYALGRIGDIKERLVAHALMMQINMKVF